MNNNDESSWDLLSDTVVEPEPLEATEEELLPYVGRYSRPYAEIELGILGGKLVGQLTYKGGFPDKDSPPEPPPMSIGLLEKDCLVVLDGPAKGDTAEIVRNPDDSVGWLRAESRLHARQP